MASYFSGVSIFAGHFAVNVFHRGDLGPQVIERLMRDVAIGTLSADPLGVLEVDTALIFARGCCMVWQETQKAVSLVLWKTVAVPASSAATENNPDHQNPKPSPPASLFKASLFFGSY
ncbi:Uncharacterised protein [Serratia fonticola]|uniref:Uncharacterized protein n=1 Tax=Serratia fonticola TaxID=47917 RepID=A0A4U9UTF2_SERFO|nr:Uncharacterised protein [Serratia fonticola]